MRLIKFMDLNFKASPVAIFLLDMGRMDGLNGLCEPTRYERGDTRYIRVALTATYFSRYTYFYNVYTLYLLPNSIKLHILLLVVIDCGLVEQSEDFLVP